jgi:hypothetical protein
MKKKQIVQHTLIVLGALILLTGVILLLRTTGHIEKLGSLWPVIIIVTGLFFLYIVFFHGGAPRFIFPGVFLTLIGIAYLLFNTIFPFVTLEKVWPVFMCIAGISILTYGLTKYGIARTVLLIPGISIIALSIIFLPFSFELIEKDLTVFVSIWWPLFLIIIGADMIIAFFIRKKERKERDE